MLKPILGEVSFVGAAGAVVTLQRRTEHHALRPPQHRVFAAGSHHVLVHQVGFRDAEYDLNVRAHQRYELPVRLEPLYGSS